MKVLHVADISIPTTIGYTSRTRYIVGTQKALGLDPIVLTSPRHESPDHRAVEVLDGIHHHRSPHKPGTPIPVELNILRQRVVEVAREEKPDIIHAHSSILCGIPAYAAARQLGLPMVYEIRAFWEDAAVDARTNSGPGSAKYESIRFAETRLAKGADALIGICKGIKDDLVARDIPAEDIFVVPNGVDTDKFVPLPPNEAVREKYGLQGKKVVAYIGTFAAFEGVRYLVQALIKLIKSGRDDIRGLIVGEGETYEACKQLAKDAGMEDKILHPGKVPHADVNGLYSIIDVLAYPRDSQRITELVTPLKPLEALAMEKGVVASNVGGLLELIQDNVTGLIHKAEDVDDLVAKIVQLIDDPVLRARLGKTGREWVIANRQWRTIIGKEIDVYTHARTRWSRHSWAWQGIGKTFEWLR